MLASVMCARLSTVTAIALALLSAPLHANVLVPGDTNVPPDVFTLPANNQNPPLLGSLNGTFNIANGSITGAWQQFVLVDPLGVTCAGCLDFVLQLTVDQTSIGNVFGLNLGRVFGFTTDVGYAADNNAGNNVGYVPTTVSRGGGGAGIGFNLINVSQTGALSPGQSTAFFVVATNATTFDTSGNLVINGFRFDTRANASTQINGLFEPTSVPEPSTIVLLGVGIIGIAARRKKA